MEKQTINNEKIENFDKKSKEQLEQENRELKNKIIHLENMLETYMYKR